MSEELFDVSENLLELVKLSPAIPTPIWAPVQVQDWISGLLETHSAPPSRPAANPPLLNSSRTPINFSPIRVEHNVQLTRETKLSTLYIYEDPDFDLEYPETSTEGAIGYLLRRDPQNWTNPLLDLAYSNGKPGGQTARNKAKPCSLLRDPSDENNEILCIRVHSACMLRKN